MTTTMTTIGYGDYHAAQHPYYSHGDNMTLIFFLLFFAIFTFSLIQDRLLSIVFDVNLQTVVNNTVSATEIWLNEMDLVLRRAWENKKKNLPKHASMPDRSTLDEKVWKDVICTIETHTRHSCFVAFI